LSAEEREAYCAWAVDEMGGGGATITCPEGTVTVPTVDECIEETEAYADCGITVSQLETCILAVSEDVCQGLEQQQCFPLLDCVDDTGA